MSSPIYTYLRIIILYGKAGTGLGIHGQDAADETLGELGGT